MIEMHAQPPMIVENRGLGKYPQSAQNIILNALDPKCKQISGGNGMQTINELFSSQIRAAAGGNTVIETINYKFKPARVFLHILLPKPIRIDLSFKARI